ncbi:MAG: ClpXP protease specificity-enhancing factor SspB [Amylibacter sp.]|nr:ClpXP protease specificity-enhancing factor SspB [Amylibacter sp.]|tara:strand:- start:1557 stop:2024 length:468 start_codon:yes stop_codon:yes gene_type:complete
MTDKINYSQMMHCAMQGLMIELLENISEHGLPGSHHFLISFDTRNNGVKIAPWIKELYPEEMTIVIQNWFENLDVRKDDFSITLNFGDNPETLIIPWNSISTFVDPSVEFGLRFEAEENSQKKEVPESPMIVIEETDAPKQKEAEVVSLDSFRKK